MTATDQNPQQSAQPTPRKTINVVGAAIVKDGKVLCAQRGEGRSLAGFWEFPGGKQEPGETMPECLYRELKEEFGLETEIGDFIMTSPYDYETGSIVLHAYFVSAPDAEIKKLDAHEQYKWVTPSELSDYEFAPADRPIVAALLKSGLL